MGFFISLTELFSFKTKISMWARTFHHVKNKLEKAENVGNKAKGRISKRVFLENKARQIFRKTNISYPLKQSLTKISRRKILNENFSHFIVEILRKMCTAWKVSKYGVFSGLCFPVFGLQNLLSKSPHSLRIRENTNQKNIRVGTLFTQFENKKCGFLTKNVSLFH